MLDLKNTIHLVSRLRIVWGDEQSTPEERLIEVSIDSKEWKPFCSGSKKTVDYYSWWPGYEYYSSNPVQARSWDDTDRRRCLNQL